MTDPMAVQMAQLLTGSDERELQEIIARWLAEAPTDQSRHYYQRFGQKLLELKRQLQELPVQPSREELELALTMMLKLAAQRGPEDGR